MSKKNNQKSKSSISNYYFISLKNLHKKYNSFENSYALICINNIVYTEKCHIVARFKDYLYYDDSTEFFNKFFKKNELNITLTKIFNFYSKYCKVFPNYMILPENEFLYKNLRKKQKMIDQFNEIKREEEENRKHIKLKKNKENENDYIIFKKKVQESIERYTPSFTQSSIVMKEYINFNGNEKKESKIFNDNSITISLNYNNTNNFDLNDINSSELTLISIANNINTTPKKTQKKINNCTPIKKKLKTEKMESIDQKNNNGINKKFISHFQNLQNLRISNSITNNNENINTNNNTTNENIIPKKEIKTNLNKKSKNFIGQSKTSNNLFISSITKSNKEKINKNNTKNLKGNIAKKKLFRTNEKTMTQKPIYYYNKNIDKNSNSIITNKYKKNYQDNIYVSVKPSISPPNTKLNSIKLKIMENLISKNKKLKSNILVYKNNNNLSYITKNKNMKSFQISDNTDKINLSKNKIDKKINKNVSNNTKKTAKEIMNDYKNILKNKKNNHFSHDINKNSLFNKNIFNNLTEKNVQKNTSIKKNKKIEHYNKYISPSNRKDIAINGKFMKTPLKPELKVNNKYHNIIIKTKQNSQAKIQNFIKKILDKNNNKKGFFIDQSKTKQNIVS